MCFAILIGCGGGAKSQSNATGAQNEATGTQVKLQSPQAGTFPTPLSVRATATSPSGISGMIVYVDDHAQAQQNQNSGVISASVPLSNGNHIIYVRAWDQGGANFGTSPTLQVSVQNGQATVVEAAAPTSSASPPPAGGDPAPPPSALPGIPGNATVFSSIQNMDGWLSCSSCAGGSPTGNFWTASHQSNPSLSGSSREFFVGGHAWSNALWYLKVAPGQSGASHFLWDFYVRFDGSSAAHAHSAEYDLWQAIGGHEFMMGSQCNFETGVWDVWDSKSFQWKPTDAGCRRFSPDTWHHVQWYVERWGSDQYHYGILVVDGNAHHFDRTFQTNWAGWDDSVGVQFQLDQDASGTPLHEWVDNVKLSIW
jgi:hypothetical protein